MVSVCVQTYQHAPYIKECLDSILIQKTTFDFEILLGEDGSDDGTREICIEYAREYPQKIRLFLNSRKNVIYVNGSPTGRWNLINNLKNARGKYIALLEGDDYWTDQFKLQKQVDALETNPDCVSCHHWQETRFEYEDGHYKIIPTPQKNTGYFPKKKATVKNIFTNQLRVKTRTHMFRNILNEFPEWFYHVQFGDVPLSMILGKSGNFYFIDEPMAVYRHTGKGVSYSGMGDKMFYLNRNLSWIEIWEYGLRYYQYKYFQEGGNTIRFFYKKIIDNTAVSIVLIFKLLSYSLLISKLPFKRRLHFMNYNIYYIAKKIFIQFRKQFIMR